MAAIHEKIHLPFGQAFRLLRWTNNLRDVSLVESRNSMRPISGEGEHWHYHEALELTYFESGEGTRFVGDQIQRFSAGDLLVLGENLPHYWQTRGPSSGWSLQWDIPPTHHLWSLFDTKALFGFFKDASRGIQISGTTAQKISDLLREFSYSEGLDQLGILLRIFATLVDTPSSDVAYICGNSLSLTAASRHRESMQAAIRFLLANFRREIYLAEVLVAARMSKPTFARQFKKHTGKTMNEFLQQIRMDAASRELAETERPVTEVALECGFTQISFFNRAFRRTFDCSPVEFRHRSRQPVTKNIPRFARAG
jgi:AraC-like DNA-binding protein